jgi:hypothetical protein
MSFSSLPVAGSSSTTIAPGTAWRAWG